MRVSKQGFFWADHKKIITHAMSYLLQMRGMVFNSATEDADVVAVHLHGCTDEILYHIVNII